MILFTGTHRFLDKDMPRLFEIMSTMLNGEALALSQSAGDFDGMAAWQRVHILYNPKTLAKTMQRAHVQKQR